MIGGVGFLGATDFDLTDPALQRTYVSSVLRIALARIPIRTGAHRGCDQVAARTALEAGGRVTLVLPWANYERKWVEEMREVHESRCVIQVFDRHAHGTWGASVSKYRRPDEAMTPSRFKLYARVYGIVEPCELVIAMPLTAEKGGTGQGMRIARGVRQGRAGCSYG